MTDKPEIKVTPDYVVVVKRETMIDCTITFETVARIPMEEMPEFNELDTMYKEEMIDQYHASSSYEVDDLGQTVELEFEELGAIQEVRTQDGK
jgi:hypothetical protein